VQHGRKGKRKAVGAVRTWHRPNATAATTLAAHGAAGHSWPHMTAKDSTKMVNTGIMRRMPGSGSLGSLPDLSKYASTRALAAA
jgi:histidine ammonia-lyase